MDSPFPATFNTAFGEKVADVDKLTSAAFLSTLFPQQIQEAMAYNEALRRKNEENSKVSSRGLTTGLTKDETCQDTASFPTVVQTILLHYAPETLWEPEKFYKWLNKHPEWRVGRTVCRT
jgi:hypothetical protein